MTDLRAKSDIKYVIVGASGFVGANLLRYLRGKDHLVIGTRSSTVKDGLIRFDLEHDDFLKAMGPEFLREPGKTCVIIAAVVSDMDQCFLEPVRSRTINVDRTIKLIKDLESIGAKTVFLSSCFVFDGTKGYYSEGDACIPANEYGRHKYEVEQFIASNVPGAFVARLDKIVGDRFDERQLFAHWYDSINHGKPIVCLQGSLLSPTYVLDVGRALEMACESNLSGIYHVSNAEFFYRDELARQFCMAMDVSPNVTSRELKDFNFPDNRALKSYLDGSRFRKETGMAFTSMSEVFKRFRQQTPAASTSRRS